MGGKTVRCGREFWMVVNKRSFLFWWNENGATCCLFTCCSSNTEIRICFTRSSSTSNHQSATKSSYHHESFYASLASLYFPYPPAITRPIHYGWTSTLSSISLSSKCIIHPSFCFFCHYACMIWLSFQSISYLFVDSWCCTWRPWVYHIKFADALLHFKLLSIDSNVQA